ncbi:hypothetical protein KGF56_002955 [Candida oxycetoniae]|uniref:Uncharacterized protein n=1 Tax=Candida oxycetoniae TaxID=497107 RepID=A0AAI9SWK1_9ASCO|nr:uncharacterized protein KGF56_002955 [Candida oxycetoniae]KAI3404194.2 hypothetical protein KGF56_002955 [Candida oxycetoniae]
MFIDVSEIRQVPDTQEVFINEIPSDSGHSKEKQLFYDQSLIIDLLEQVSSSEYKSAIAEHMQDIAPSSAENIPLEQMEDASDNEIMRYFSYLVFKPEYKRQEKNQATKIVLLVCLIRLNKVETDVIIQYVIPLKSGDEVGETINFTNPKSDVDSLVAEKYKFFKEICTKFKVDDWNLFA